MEDNCEGSKEQKLSSIGFVREYIERVQRLLENLDAQAVAAVVDAFARARERDNTIFFLGNGGSAATAEHFANDLTVGASSGGGPMFRAVSLASNTATLTCIANDFGYNHVFERQLSNLMRPGDVVVGISASGNSLNVVRALEYAALHEGIPIAIVGFDGGEMKRLARYVIHLQSPTGDYGPVEDVHLVLDHVITQYLAALGEQIRTCETQSFDPT